MPVKELRKSSKPAVAVAEEKVKKFINQGGGVATIIQKEDTDHRLTLRIPRWLMDKVDAKRKKRVGSISRNLWILEVLDKATRN
jgi:hypothetical protein